MRAWCFICCLSKNHMFVLRTVNIWRWCSCVRCVMMGACFLICCLFKDQVSALRAVITWRWCPCVRCQGSSLWWWKPLVQLLPVQGLTVCYEDCEYLKMVSLCEVPRILSVMMRASCPTSACPRTSCLFWGLWIPEDGVLVWGAKDPLCDDESLFLHLLHVEWESVQLSPSNTRENGLFIHWLRDRQKTIFPVF